MTAVMEYWQEATDRPGTFAALDVAAGAILVVRDDPTRIALGLTPDDLRAGRQKTVAFNLGEPATRRGADRAVQAGAAGLLIPSTRRRDGTNPVLWRVEGRDTRVRVHDPQGELPRPPANAR